MTKPIPRGTFTRSHECGWVGTYDLEGMADYQLRRHSCEKARRIAARKERGAARMAAVDRTPKTCLHPQANHQHGTYPCYTLDRCRCTPCSEAASAYDKNLARQKAYGRYDTWTDPEPVRKHIRALMAQGMGLKRIIAVGGSNSGQLWKLLYGTVRPDGSRIPTKRIRRDVAERLLAVELDLASGANVPARGTVRRVRALIALGWSQNRLAEQLGFTPQNFSQIVHETRPCVTVRTAEAVKALYDELSMTHPTATGRSQLGGINRAKRYAARNGWLPPLAIDDECLDDDFDGGQLVIDLPADDLDEVAIERRMAGDKSVRLSKPEKHELYLRWVASGRPLAELERATGVNPGREAKRALKEAS